MTSTATEVKRIINIDLANLLLENGHTLKYIDKVRDRKTGAIKVYFFFEKSEQLQAEVDSFMLELEEARRK